MNVYHYTATEPHVFTVATCANNSHALPPNCTKTPPPTTADDMQAVFSTALGVWTVKPKPISVPTEVSMWKAKSVLALRGYVGQVEHELALLPEPEATVAKLKWQHATVIARSDSLVSNMASKFGWDTEYVDGLFLEAHQLK